MQIDCPNCATSYEVDALSIGAAGRPVRCARCMTIWHVSAPDSASHGAVPPNPATDEDAVAAFQRELGSTPPAAPDPTDGPGTRAPLDIETAAAAAAESDQPLELSEELNSPAPETDESVPVAEAPSLVPELPNEQVPVDVTPDPAAGVPKPRRRRSRRPREPRSRRFGLLGCVIVGLLAVIGALIGWRGEIVRHAPQMASLYSAIGLPVNLRKLVFTEVRVARDAHDGVPMLLVEGTIASTSPQPIDVPRLRFAIRNAAGAEVYTWTAPPPQPKLAPFEQLAFSSRVAAPPGTGQDVVVRFLTPRDVIANSK